MRWQTVIQAVAVRSDDRPRQDAPGREHEAGGDHDDALGARADADVALEAERLGAGARVGDEERAGDRGDGDDDEDVLVVAGEDVGDRGEHEALADPVGRRVEERAERRRLPAGPGERAVEDVEDRPGDEEPRAEPVEEELVVGSRTATRTEAIAQSVTPLAVSAFGVTRVRARPPIDRVASERAPVV